MTGELASEDFRFPDQGVVAYMRRQSFVDANDVVALGHSWGGLWALGVAFDAPPGVVGIIDFAGGAGSFAPGQICSGKERLIAALGRLGAGDHIPEICIYAEERSVLHPFAGACHVRRLSSQSGGTGHLR